MKERTRRQIPCKWAVDVECLVETGTIEACCCASWNCERSEGEVGLDPSKRESSCGTGVRAVLVGRGRIVSVIILARARIRTARRSSVWRLSAVGVRSHSLGYSKKSRGAQFSRSLSSSSRTKVHVGPVVVDVGGAWERKTCGVISSALCNHPGHCDAILRM